MRRRPPFVCGCAPLAAQASQALASLLHSTRLAATALRVHSGVCGVGAHEAVTSETIIGMISDTLTGEASPCGVREMRQSADFGSALDVIVVRLRAPGLRVCGIARAQMVSRAAQRRIAHPSHGWRIFFGSQSSVSAIV
jgi:hypothetical protein